MKKCSDCNIEMIEDTNLHTDYVGGVSFEERIYLTTYDRTETTKTIKTNKIDNFFKNTRTLAKNQCPCVFIIKFIHRKVLLLLQVLNGRTYHKLLCLRVFCLLSEICL